MAHINNIYNLKVNGVANTGSINFGNVIHKGHQANVKANIGYLQQGDNINSPLQFNNANLSTDPDVQDQAQGQI
ncbi:spore germination protein [Xylanibacillus composti]|uniref:Spore germination protein n=1 Tax=Xylanibacillus composti TaxID=1572762 RepID=A0A8J4H1J1_9BACL|nr:spore germination protein [Xylanibacillus composti]GIQ67870.1 hypothetical protein XYCOK13_06940 [Xylanibacillus composti]